MTQEGTPQTLAAPAETSSIPPQEQAPWQAAMQLLESERTADREEGERRLRDLARGGDPQAMLRLGALLMDGGKVKRNPKEGEEWFGKAADGGDVEAMIELSNRLLEGRGIKTNTREGEQWLRRAAQTSDPAAMWKLGERLSNGIRIAQNREEGRQWLRKAAQADHIDAISGLGLVCYREGEFREAVEMFLKALKAGVEGEGNNIAYMIRRREIPDGIEVPSLEALLDPLVEAGSPLARINQALRLAAGVQCEPDWEAADQVISGIGNREAAQEALNWWWGLADGGDAEGHLVVGWLVRHGLADDPNRHSVSRRMSRARKGGWDVPAWMDQPHADAAAALAGRPATRRR